jgi:hypothetical protein
VREVFEGAVRAGERVLSSLGYDETEVERIAEAFMEHDRTMLAELAALWDPAVPPERNAAYRAKEREQHEAIVAALRGRRGAGPPPEGPAGEAAAADAQSPD